MNLVVAIAYALSVLIYSPSPCSHAIGGGDSAQSHMHEKHEEHDHSTSLEMIHDAGHHDRSHNHQSDTGANCAEGCDGGVGCDGCVASASAIVADGPAIGKVSPKSSYIIHANEFSMMANALEPPPPRHG